MEAKLIHGECLKEMAKLKSGSVDMVLCDPPYGATACKWDSVIPMDQMWKQLKRIVKPNGAIALFGTEPFSSHLRLSNIEDYRYDWTWDKGRGFGVFLAKKQPLRKTENICIFYKSQPAYNPAMTPTPSHKIRKLSRANKNGGINNITGSKNCQTDKDYRPEMSYPVNLLTYIKPVGRDVHPTQKPTELMEYLIRTYTNEGDVILDFTMGSGTTGIACANLNRDFVGVELDEEYFKIAESRIIAALDSPPLFIS